MSQIQWPAFSIGSLIAIVILILVVVLAVIGRINMLEAVLIGGLALARLT